MILLLLFWMASAPDGFLESRTPEESQRLLTTLTEQIKMVEDMKLVVPESLKEEKERLELMLDRKTREGKLAVHTLQLKLFEIATFLSFPLECGNVAAELGKLHS